MQDKLNRIKHAASSINKVADEAAAEVKRVETWLAENKVGTRVWVMCPGHGVEMGYDRFGSDFRIMLKDKDGEAKPWTDCVRRLRMDTLPYLPSLIVQIMHSVEEELNKAAKKLDDLRLALPPEIGGTLANRNETDDQATT